jgi:hypothetical protein
LFHLVGEKLWNIDIDIDNDIDIDIDNDIDIDMLLFDDLKIKNTHSATLNFLIYYLLFYTKKRVLVTCVCVSMSVTKFSCIYLPIPVSVSVCD